MSNSSARAPLFTMHLTPADTAPVFARRAEAALWDMDQSEGQLTVDVAETAEHVIVIAPMAGALGNQIDVYIQHDLLTIRGSRLNPAPGGSQYIYQECFWGKFSRSIVLPVEVKGELSRAEFRGGVLTIHIPKVSERTAIPVRVVKE